MLVKADIKQQPGAGTWGDGFDLAACLNHKNSPGTGAAAADINCGLRAQGELDVSPAPVRFMELHLLRLGFLLPKPTAVFSSWNKQALWSDVLQAVGKASHLFWRCKGQAWARLWVFQIPAAQSKTLTCAEAAESSEGGSQGGIVCFL